MLRRWSRSTFAFALMFAFALLIAEIITQSSFSEPSNIPAELATFAPFAILAMASTPSILSGGGGIDLSVGPLATLVNCIFVAKMLPHGWSPVASVIVLLALGALLGAINGTLVAVLRYQPVIATLCAFFVFSGLSEKIAPNPGSAPGNWTVHLANSVGFLPGAILTIGFPILIWLLLSRTAFLRNLMAAGGDDASAYSAGVNVVALRIAAYALGGVFAAVAGFALTAQIQTSSASLSTEYALIALAGVALGGTPLGGGRGGILGSLLGAACIYLLQQLLSSAGVSSDYLQLVYGALLIAGVLVSSRYRGRLKGIAA